VEIVDIEEKKMLSIVMLFEPPTEMKAFLSSQKSFGEAWRACARSDWMVWLLQNKTKYANTAKMREFADLLLVKKGKGEPSPVSVALATAGSGQPSIWPSTARVVIGQRNNEWLETLDLCLARIERSVKPNSFNWSEAGAEQMLKDQAEQLRRFLGEEYLAPELW
jgi:hypothetical protein